MGAGSSRSLDWIGKYLSYITHIKSEFQSWQLVEYNPYPVYTSPHIYEVMQSPDSTPRLLHVFENTTGTCGIAATSTPDVFFVVTGNFSFESLSPTPRSYAIHRLAFEKCGKPIVEEIAALGTIAQPNGMTAVPNTPYVLIADSYGGFVYRFDTETLQLTTYLDHPVLKPQPVAGIVFGMR
jgi:hypothetical protein